MYLSELQTKDIVSVIDGRRLGRIIDAQIDTEGKIIHLVIESKRGLRSFMNQTTDVTIKFTDINKIGEDVILVNI